MFGITVDGRFHEMDLGEMFELLRVTTKFDAYMSKGDVYLGEAYPGMVKLVSQLLEDFPPSDY